MLSRLGRPLHATYQQLHRDETYEMVLRDMVDRDERDKNRPLNPLGPGPDSIIVDTTGISIDQALNTMQHAIDAFV